MRDKIILITKNDKSHLIFIQNSTQECEGNENNYQFDIPDYFVQRENDIGQKKEMIRIFDIGIINLEGIFEHIDIIAVHHLD